jgi:phosphoribosyl 1,2-cyclic phosphate phosphodiesterase
VRLTFLGTAASEGYPNAFCGCSACDAARAMGGRNIRRRSSALINDDLLIDFGPDLMAASWSLNLPLHTVRYALQTHEHNDHLDPGHFFSRSATCGVPGVQDLGWYSSRGAGALAASQLLAGTGRPTALMDDPELMARLNLRHYPIAPYETTWIGDNRYRVFSVPATHGNGIEAMLHAIERDGRRLFYATDTGPLPEAVWQALAGDGWRFDLVAMDHTFGFAGRSTGHMNAEQFLEQIAAMRRYELIGQDTRLLATHLAHHSNPLHDELAAFAAEHGYEIAYDGLVVHA